MPAMTSLGADLYGAASNTTNWTSYSVRVLGLRKAEPSAPRCARADLRRSPS